MANFSERLKQLRDAHGVSQQELAEYLKVNKQTISGYERGVRRPAGKGAQIIYEKLADYFNVDIAYLMGLSDVTLKLSDPCKEISHSIPYDLVWKYSELDPNRQANINDFIEKEYKEYKEWIVNYERVSKLDKITNIEDAKVILGNTAAFGGYASDNALIKMANIVLKENKTK